MRTRIALKIYSSITGCFVTINFYTGLAGGIHFQYVLNIGQYTSSGVFKSCGNSCQQISGPVLEVLEQ
jgi:hypothetical protein